MNAKKLMGVATAILFVAVSEGQVRTGRAGAGEAMVAAGGSTTVRPARRVTARKPAKEPAEKSWNLAADLRACDLAFVGSVVKADLSQLGTVPLPGALDTTKIKIPNPREVEYSVDRRLKGEPGSNVKVVITLPTTYKTWGSPARRYEAVAPKGVRSLDPVFFKTGTEHLVLLKDVGGQRPKIVGLYPATEKNVALAKTRLGQQKGVSWGKVTNGLRASLATSARSLPASKSVELTLLLDNVSKKPIAIILYSENLPDLFRDDLVFAPALKRAGRLPDYKPNFFPGFKAIVHPGKPFKYSVTLRRHSNGRIFLGKEFSPDILHVLAPARGGKVKLSFSLRRNRDAGWSLPASPISSDPAKPAGRGKIPSLWGGQLISNAVEIEIVAPGGNVKIQYAGSGGFRLRRKVPGVKQPVSTYKVFKVGDRIKHFKVQRAGEEVKRLEIDAQAELVELTSEKRRVPIKKHRFEKDPATGKVKQVAYYEPGPEISVPVAIVKDVRSGKKHKLSKAVGRDQGWWPEK